MFMVKAGQKKFSGIFVQTGSIHRRGIPRNTVALQPCPDLTYFPEHLSGQRMLRSIGKGSESGNILNGHIFIVRKPANKVSTGILNSQEISGHGWRLETR